jgi:Ni,Fe-hydrogenase III large subunit
MTARKIVDAADWAAAADRLGNGNLTLLALWGEPDCVTMALSETAEPSRVSLVTLPCPSGSYPSVGRVHPPAIRLERAIVDLFGLEPVGLPDPRPWLDHGTWGLSTPLAATPAVEHATQDYIFLPSEGAHLHQVPVGPVHAGIIESGHFRFTADGETVVRLEARLGYAHRGLEKLFQGADLDRAARLAGRCSGDSTVAYALAFAQAVEEALGWTPPRRAVWLRALMGEMERLMNHLGDVGAICNDAAFPIMLTHCGTLRERVLREAAACFGHRLMMDVVVPGGVRADLDGTGAARIRMLAGEIRGQFRSLVALFEKTSSLQDRMVGTGILTSALAQQYGAGGYVGRASARQCDARRWPGYAPYDEVSFDIPVLPEGDVNARIWIRIREIEQSLSLIAQILTKLPAGPIFTAGPPSATAGEGMALVEGFRGDIFVWLRIGADGRVSRCYLRDPSWFQWPLLEAAILGNIIADFPLCNKSFNCSYAGVDL